MARLSLERAPVRVLDEIAGGRTFGVVASFMALNAYSLNSDSLTSASGH
jgi:hypothetical protein